MSVLEQIKKNAVPGTVPCLDQEFIPAVLWDRAFRKAVKESGKVCKIKVVMERNDQSASAYDTEVFANPTAEEFAANMKHVERLVKAMFWIKGG